MTNMEIILKTERENLEYRSEEGVMSRYVKLEILMDEARKDEAVEFALFLFDYKPNSETNGWTKYEFGVFMEFSTEELYQLFKNR